MSQATTGYWESFVNINSLHHTGDKASSSLRLLLLLYQAESKGRAADYPRDPAVWSTHMMSQGDALATGRPTDPVGCPSHRVFQGPCGMP